MNIEIEIFSCQFYSKCYIKIQKSEAVIFKLTIICNPRNFQDISNLRDWKWIDLEKKPSVLTAEGFQELLEFGQRFRQKFYFVLADLNQSLIRTTDEIRTNRSAKAFIRGLEDLGSTLFIENSIREDYTIRVTIHTNIYLIIILT